MYNEHNTKRVHLCIIINMIINYRHRLYIINYRNDSFIKYVHKLEANNIDIK